MKRASIVVDPFYRGNKLFALEDPKINRDDCLYSFSSLRQALARQGYDLKTNDLHSVETSDLVIYNEMPKVLPPEQHRAKSILLLFESELIRPDNWDKSAHDRFKSIFTWRDDWVDGLKYVKSNFAHRFPEPGLTLPFSDQQLCTLIAGNKSVSHPLELYSKRREAIDWFEANAPEDFEYFGVGWERSYLKGGFATKLMRKTGVLNWLPEKPSRCYGGAVDSKIETLRRFRFSICFENAQGIPGYITEKIFDSFFAGCVPVYWGAPNITDHVPPECFVDFREFRSYSDLHAFLKSMSESQYAGYLNAIQTFLGSPNADPFRAEKFAENFIQNVEL